MNDIVEQILKKIKHNDYLINCSNNRLNSNLNDDQYDKEMDRFCILRGKAKAYNEILGMINAI